MHCPQCGKPLQDQAIACQSCGSVLDVPREAAGASRGMARTMMGVAGGEARIGAASRSAGAPPGGAQTIVGLPAASRPKGAGADEAGAGGRDAQKPSGMPAHLLQTKVGHQSPSPEAAARALADHARAGAHAQAGAQPGYGPNDPSRGGGSGDARTSQAAEGSKLPSTLSSIADPGRAQAPYGNHAQHPPPVAPTQRDGTSMAHNANGHEPSPELGATVVNQLGGARAPAKRLKAHAVHIPRPIPPSELRKAPKANAAAKLAKIRGGEAVPMQNAPIALVIGAAVLAAGAVLFAVLWPAKSPVRGHIAVDAQGRETLELTCSSCPEGTTLSIGQRSAPINRGAAVVTPESPLAAGDNRFKVRIDRPGDERDETVPLVVHLPYRIRPELATLQGERAAIQVVVEAAPGARITLDGRQVPLVGGRAVETFDVNESCTGLTEETKSLSRQIPYVVTPKDGEPERGSVSVMVGIVPLHLDAPGSSVVIDVPSFVLAGRTLKGAELFAAGKPVPVKADGSFAHVMNVSSIGATQIEVRAKLAGMAPRLTRIKVRRVDNLDTAAREFAAESPITYAALGADIARQAGRPIMLGGQVIDVKRENHKTNMVLDVGPSVGCKGCVAHLVQGANNPVQTGEQITAYGRVRRAVRAAGGADVPEIEVDFTVKGLR
jgi:hypothetical protein